MRAVRSLGFVFIESDARVEGVPEADDRSGSCCGNALTERTHAKSCSADVHGGTATWFMMSGG
jgi:hypothetical protein